jgi:hypothetical protein
MDRRARAIVVGAMAACAMALGAVPAAAATTPGPTPVLAYYYIWFDVTSWNRAKLDYPLLGRYSSDERSVMQRQIRWAKQVGIHGFIVSWKSTPVLDRRLQTLIDVATQERFKLAIIYQGLDFHREPLPVDKVASDLELFAQTDASAAPFQLYDKPLVIWSGTWRFSPSDIRRVTAGVRDRLLVLASEKQPERYGPIADAVDGNAYYWSSADPMRTPGYPSKLRQLGQVVHRSHGLWIAPAAPGFDARLIGGTRVIPRRDGRTLRRALDVAAASAPDAIGILSWNEFSENSQIEPSKLYGFQSLRVLAGALHATVPGDAGFDSSDSPPTGVAYGLPLLGGFVVVLLGGAALASRRRRRVGRRPRVPGPARQADGGGE